MTYAPKDLLAIRAVIQSYTGLTAAGLGIVPDAAHRLTGGYHCGQGDLSKAFGEDLKKADGRYEYSVRQARDRDGLTDASSALDIGSWSGLRKLSRQLVIACRSNVPGTECIREIIWSPNGRTVERYDALGEQTGGDSSHRWHTHLSFWRDTEGGSSREHCRTLIEALLSPTRLSTPPYPGSLLRYPPITFGADVRLWQTRMRERGWAITVDGAYGKESKAICLAFQREKGLAQDGIVGPATWRATWEAPIT